MTDLQTLATTANGYYGDQHHQQLQPHAPLGYGHQGSNGSQGYYAPTQQPSGSTYGHVYYPASHGGDGGNGTSVDSRNQGISALNNFYYDTQRGTFDPKSYSQVESRLMAIQAGQFPFLSSGGGMSDYQPAAAPIGTAGPQVGVYGSSPQYLLPGLNNLRTKNDLLDIDRIMEQAQATIYEHPNQMAAAGIDTRAQPDTYHISSSTHYRQSQSPPSTQLRSLHNTGEPSAPQVINAPTPSRDSPPALTPTGSAQSFNSARSPASVRSNRGVSPVATGSMYPTLPGTSSAAMSNGYFPSSMAPTSTLANQFDGDELRRFRGGNLQRAQPSRTKEPPSRINTERAGKQVDEMDRSDDAFAMVQNSTSDTLSETDEIPRTRTRRRSVEVSPSMIDPALSGATLSPSGELDERDIKADENWVVMARTIEGLRAWIKHRVENGEFENMDEPGSDDEDENFPAPSLYPLLRQAQMA